MSERPQTLSGAERARLLSRLAERAPATAPERPAPEVPGRDLSNLAFYRQIQLMRAAGVALGIEDPFLRPHEGVAGAESAIGGRRCLNFSSYNYLGLNGHPRVAEAAKAAIDRYGASVSASRLVAGERPIHRALEQRLAQVHGTEDCVAFVSGHAANVTVIGHLLGPNDLILHDALIHNSVLEGARLSGARRLSFPHNDAAAAEAMLGEQRARGQALVVIEGHYSMDGDVPDLATFVELARRHDAWLMVDEAHSLGVLGAAGRGLSEHRGADPAGVDLWMGTLSKTLASCGGYIAGRRDLVEYLKLSAPGFVYSVGLSPPLAAAALAALDLMLEEPERVARLNANARLFLDGAQAAGLDTGLSEGLGIVPIITGSSIVAARLSQALLQVGINVQPILYPAVPERSARLRFFLSSEHTPEQIETAVAAVAREDARVRAQAVDLAALAERLGAASV